MILENLGRIKETSHRCRYFSKAPTTSMHSVWYGIVFLKGQHVITIILNKTFQKKSCRPKPWKLPIIWSVVGVLWHPWPHFTLIYKYRLKSSGVGISTSAYRPLGLYPISCTAQLCSRAARPSPLCAIASELQLKPDKITVPRQRSFVNVVIRRIIQWKNVLAPTGYEEIPCKPLISKEIYTSCNLLNYTVIFRITHCNPPIYKVAKN